MASNFSAMLKTPGEMRPWGAGPLARAFLFLSDSLGREAGNVEAEPVLGT